MTKKYYLGVPGKEPLDTRDKLLELPKSVNLPKSFSLPGGFLGPVLDQSISNSCTAHMGRVGAYFTLGKTGDKRFDISRLFLYWNSRKDKSKDTGAHIKDVLKAFNRYGICDESLWPFDIKKIIETPPVDSFKAAINSTGLSYERVSPINEANLKFAIFEGYPIMLAIRVYESFYRTGKDGIVNYSPEALGDFMGGHAIVFYGWKEIAGKTYFCGRNSWGNDWGDAGNFYFPASEVDTMSFDAWVLTELSGNTKVKDFLDGFVKKFKPDVSEDVLFENASKLYNLFSSYILDGKPISTEARLTILRTIDEIVKSKQ